MATSYTSLLGLALPVTGELAGTWGDTVNNAITSLLDTAIAGTTTLSADTDVTLTTTTGASNQARQAILLCSGARTALRTITAPAQSKIYVVINSTTGGYGVKLVGAGPTTGVTVAAGKTAVLVWNGSDFVEVAPATATTATNLAGGAAGSVPYQTGSGATTFLSLGTAAQVLQVNAGATAPEWVSSTGTGNVVRASSPTLTTPTLGVASATSINKVTITAPATGSTLTIADGKTLTASNTLTFTGTDSSSVAFGTGGTVAYTSNNLSVFAATTSAQLAGVISDETGSGSLVFGTSPTLATPTITTSATVPLLIGGTGTTSTLTLRSTSGVGTTGADIIFQTGNNGATEAMRILNSGNVGIGTASPTRKLNISGAGAFGDAAAPAIRFDNTSSGRLAIIDYDNSQNLNIWNSQDSGTGAINFYSSTGSGTLHMMISGAGNVGINTASPAGKLDVVGASYIGADSNNSCYVASTSSLVTIAAAGRTSFSTSALRLSTSDGSAVLERMRIDSAGNVGIGTTAPFTLLDSVSARTTTLNSIAAFNTMPISATDSTAFAVGVGGGINFRGRLTSTTYSTLAAIWSYREAAGTNDYKGSLLFGTADNGTGYPVERMRIDSTGKVFINSTLNTQSSAWGGANVKVEGDTFQGMSVVSHSDTDGSTSFIQLLRSRGTGAAPTAVGSSTYLGSFTWSGYDGVNANYRTAAEIRCYVNGTVSSGIVPGAITFWPANTSGTPTERMRIDSAGNVGIGTNSPGNTLHVVSTAGAAAKIESSNATGGYLTIGTSSTSPLLMGFGSTLNASVTTSDAVLRANTGQMWCGTQGSNPVILYTNGSEKVRVTSTGDVGIGATSPSYMLDLRGTARAYGYTSTQIGTPGTPTATSSATGGSLAPSTTYYFKIVAVDGLSNTTSAGPEGSATTSAGATDSIAVSWSAITGARSYQIWYGTSSGGQNKYYTSTTNSYTLTTDGGTAGTIPSANTTGAVGINTAAPTRPLVVSGGSTTLLGLWGTLGSAGETGYGQDSVGGYVQQTGAYAYRWLVNGSERVRIDSAGNVGIGTNAPVNKLQVNGSLGRNAPVTKTGDFSLAATENWVICNGTGTITVTLPAASSWTGREVMIKTIAAFTVVSASSNVVPLAGGSAGTAILAATAGKWATLVSDGTNWIIMQAA